MLLALLMLTAASHAAPGPKGPHPIDINAAQTDNAPEWLTASRLERVIDKMQVKLEWDVRKIKLYFYSDAEQFKKAHRLDDTVLAFTLKPQNSVTIGPRVTSQDFDAVMGHEMVHIILHQKYKGAIPGWLEEGLGNYLSKYGRVDYAWLASQPKRDVLTLAHPFAGAAGSPRYAYQASQALMEMIASHCSVTDLVTMSVGKSLQSYLPTLCGITDLNAQYQAWIKRKAPK